MAGVTALADTPRWTVQLGAFAAPENARALLARAQLLLAAPEAQALPEADRSPRIERDGELHRVLLGARPDRDSAIALATRLGTLLGASTALYVLSR